MRRASSAPLPAGQVTWQATVERVRPLRRADLTAHVAFAAAVRERAVAPATTTLPEPCPVAGADAAGAGAVAAGGVAAGGWASAGASTVPEPVSAAVDVPAAELSATVSVALRAPAAEGVNTTPISHVAPGATGASEQDS